jgi:hypothetical protein
MARPSHLTPRTLVRHCSNQHHRRGISWGRTGLRAAQILKVDLLHQFRTPHKSPHGKPLLRKRVACPEGLILGGFCTYNLKPEQFPKFWGTEGGLIQFVQAV